MAKPILEDLQRLHIQQVKAAIPHHATAAELAVGAQTIVVHGRLTNLGNGYRYVFLCPCCGLPSEALYRRDFSDYRCRQCLGLVYASSMKRK